MIVNVQLPGALEITQMDDSELLKLEGGFEDDIQIVSWVQYHLRSSGDCVHRSVDLVLKGSHPALAFEHLIQGE